MCSGTICHFGTDLDDVGVRTGPGRCRCLRCCACATDRARPMATVLRRQLVTTLWAVDVA